MGTGPSWELAEFVTGLRLEDIPPEVIQLHKDHLLDGLGNGLYGSTSGLGRKVLSLVETFPTSGDSTVWGTKIKANCMQAAFANGTFANVAEMEDAHQRTKFKPNTCVMPAGLAVAEREGSAGKDLLVGLVAAVEVGIRVSEATHVGKEGYARGWNATSSVGPIGAAIVAGRLIGLTTEQMVHAIALAAAQPSGIWSTGLTMAKRVGIGRAADNGILAAFMASTGITGGDQVFDGEWGSFGSIISSITEMELLTRGLGQQWKCQELGFKCFPGKGSSQWAIDALLQVLEREPDLRPEEIEQIVVRTATSVVSNKALYIFPPSTFWEAQNSVPYLLAVTAADRACGLDQLTEGRWQDEQVLALGAKIRMERSEEADRMPPDAKTAFVDLHLRGGRVATGRVDYCRGEPKNPLSPAQVQQKFRAVAKAAAEEGTMRAIIETVDSLDRLADVRELTRLMGSAG